MRRQRWTKFQILAWIKLTRKGREFPSRDLVAHFKMSRQTAARLLTELVNDHELVKLGSTQTARYRLSSGTKPKSVPRLLLKKQLPGLEEDSVFEQIALRLSLKEQLAENVYRITYYAFCEMLNNAIDHSKGLKANIEIGLHSGFLKFLIRDVGIGIFKNIRTIFKLKSDEEAIEHLLKGKQTTWPEAHSGQGIFFTSKIADFYSIRSGKFKLSIDNVKGNIALAEMRSLQGTEIQFAIRASSKKSLRKLFERYANEDFVFDRTEYPILILQETGVISRSQARRLTAGLDKFDRVILDFKKVSELGQGFADEIFRIFQTKNPRMVLEVRNANAAVNFMVRRSKLAQ